MANALRVLSKSLVLSEPRVITGAVAYRSLPGWAELGCTEKTDAVRACVEAAVRIFARYPPHLGQNLVLKLSSLSLPAWGIFRAIWPEVPAVLVIRDPAEVIASNLAGRASWMGFKDQPLASGAVLGREEFGLRAVTMTDEEYCARVVRKHYAAGRQLAGKHCMIIDHRELDRAHIEAVARFFGLDCHAAPEDVERVLKTYSKDPLQATAFDRTAAEGRAHVSDATRAAAACWCARDYEELTGISHQPEAAG